MAAKRGTLQSEDVDFLPLSDIMRDLLTISYFEGLDIKFAKEPSPFKSAIKALRELHVGDLEPRLKKYNAEVLGMFNELNITTRRKILDAIQATQKETRTDRRQRILKEINGASAVVQTQFRTASQVAFNMGMYIQTQQDDSIWGYEYVTAEDDRVRPEHEAMHGVVRPKNDPIWNKWWPPNGWNCRCVLIPLDEAPEHVTDARTIRSLEPDAGWGFNPALVLLPR